MHCLWSNLSCLFWLQTSILTAVARACDLLALRSGGERVQRAGESRLDPARVVGVQLPLSAGHVGFAVADGHDSDDASTEEDLEEASETHTHTRKKKRAERASETHTHLEKKRAERAKLTTHSKRSE